MTPRESDRFEAKAREVVMPWDGDLGRLVRRVAAALRREREEALGEVRQHVEAMPVCTRVGVLRILDDLKSPAAAPATEPDRVSRLLGRGHVENPREGEPGDAETYSEPVAPAPPLVSDLVQDALQRCERARTADTHPAMLCVACAGEAARAARFPAASPAAQGKEPRKP